MKTYADRRREAEAWNNWKPGSGKRRGLNPFKDMETRKAQWYSPEGIPLTPDGKIDIGQWEKDLAKKKGK
jgi:hypothetical protein